MMNSTQAIGCRLRAARVAEGYKYAKHFAEKYGIALSTFSQHERGGRAAPIDILLTYAKLLKINPTWLIMGEGSPYTPENYDRAKEHIINQETQFVRNNKPMTPEVIDLGHLRTMVVDVELLMEVLRDMSPVFTDPMITIPANEIIDFAIDIYNSIVTTSADKVSRRTMIKLSIESLKRGVKVNTALDPKQVVKE